MKKILDAELSALKDLVRLLVQEKNLLIKLKDHLLFKVIDEKKKIVEKIELLETKRKSQYSDEALQEYLHQDPEGKAILVEIENVMKQVREQQEINLMLTTQSVVYNNNLIEIIQDAIVKAPAVYSGRGYMRANTLGVQAAFDQSV